MILLWISLSLGPARADVLSNSTEEPAWADEEGGIPKALFDISRESASLPLQERITQVSREFKGRPYQNDPIGEGVGPDPDPPVRYDVFDCLTFVEEVLALAVPSDPLEAAGVRQMLRYGPSGQMTYENRNHFMMHQWIPNNIQNGLLKDITSELGSTVELTKTVSMRTWTHWKSRARFQMEDEQFPTGEFILDVLPLDQAILALPHLPAGALIITVRENRSYVPIVVTHIGFVVPSMNPAQPMLRHATRMGAQPRVRDDFLGWYLEHQKNYKYWKVTGVVVLLPQELQSKGLDSSSN